MWTNKNEHQFTFLLPSFPFSLCIFMLTGKNSILKTTEFALSIKSKNRVIRVNMYKNYQLYRMINPFFVGSDSFCTRNSFLVSSLAFYYLHMVLIYSSLLITFIHKPYIHDPYLISYFLLSFVYLLFIQESQLLLALLLCKSTNQCSILWYIMQDYFQPSSIMKNNS